MRAAANGFEQYSKIHCVADANVAGAVASALRDLGLPEVFVQRAKQVSLEETGGFLGLGLGPTVRSAEDRAELLRWYVPKRFEAGVMRRVAEAADLFLPGRGSLFAEDVKLRRAEALDFDEDLLAELSPEGGARPEAYSVLCCIVQRGMAAPLADVVLDLGLCVPVVSFGEGMGLRNKLGLLRITIPVDKEVIYFVVPERDADLVEGLAVHKARLDRPGQGFIYRYPVRAAAVNLRVRRGKRSSAASMEQVIAALDELRGSSDWRRLAPAKPARGAREGAASEGGEALYCLSLVAEEGSVGEFVRAAMDAGAGGATLIPLEHRSYAAGKDRPVHARETCDLIIPEAVVAPVIDAVQARGLFEPDSLGIAELSYVAKAVTYRA